MCEWEMRDYKWEYRTYHSSPAQIKRRASRNKARRLMMRRFGRGVRGKDIDHINHNPLDNRISNLRIRSVRANRADNGRF
jgi:hypothetical protein